MNFVTTARARTKITAVVRRIRKETIKGGEAKVLAACQKSGVEPSAQNLDKLAMYYGFSKRDDLYYSVEKGDVVLPENVRKLFREKDENGLFKYVKQALRSKPYVGQLSIQNRLRKRPLMRRKRRKNRFMTRRSRIS